LLIFRDSRIRAPPSRRESGRDQRLKMTDIVMLAIGLGFFVIALAYVAACDRL